MINHRGRTTGSCSRRGPDGVSCPTLARFCRGRIWMFVNKLLLRADMAVMLWNEDNKSNYDCAYAFSWFSWFSWYYRVDKSRNLPNNPSLDEARRV